MKKAMFGISIVSCTICGFAFAGGSNPPGPGAQTNGSATTTQSLSRTVATAAASSVVTSAGGPSGVANSIGNLPGATTAGAVVTSPPIVTGSMTVIISVNTSTGSITVLNQQGAVIFSTEGAR